MFIDPNDVRLGYWDAEKGVPVILDPKSIIAVHYGLDNISEDEINGYERLERGVHSNVRILCTCDIDDAGPDLLRLMGRD